MSVNRPPLLYRGGGLFLSICTMAQRRMFSLQIVDSDAFLDMPKSSQLLYFHLSMRADDDGFIDNPKKVMRVVGSADDDLKILIAKRFILSFENGVVVVKHWKIHNYIAKDRYTETKYLEEKKSLFTKENGSYTDRIQNVDTMETQVRLGKYSNSISADKPRIERITLEEEPVLRSRREPNDNAKLILEEEESRMGRKFANRGKQLKTIRSILDNGYTKEELLEQLNYLRTKDKFWRNRSPDFGAVASTIHIEHD